MEWYEWTCCFQGRVYYSAILASTFSICVWPSVFGLYLNAFFFYFLDCNENNAGEQHSQRWYWTWGLSEPLALSQCNVFPLWWCILWWKLAHIGFFRHFIHNDCIPISYSRIENLGASKENTLVSCSSWLIYILCISNTLGLWHADGKVNIWRNENGYRDKASLRPHQSWVYRKSTICCNMDWR